MTGIFLFYNRVVAYIEKIWHTRHDPIDIYAQIAVMLIGAFGFVGIPVVGAGLEKQGVVFHPFAINVYESLLPWNNVCINILFFLICAEIIQTLAIGFEEYRRDNL